MTQKKQTIPFLTFRAGEGLGVPEAGMAIIRYNFDLGRLEWSRDGAPYQPLSGGADGYFYEEFLAAPVASPILDGYLAYIDYTSTELNKISVDSLLALLSSASSSLQAAYESGNTIITDSGNGEFSVSGTENISLSSFADIQVSAIGSLTIGAGGVDTVWPTLAGDPGTVLTNDGSGNLSWDPPSGGSPGGPDTAIQFNNAGSFDGSSALKWNGTSVRIENISGQEGFLSDDLLRFVAAPSVPVVGSNEVGLGWDVAVGGSPALYLKQGGNGDTAILQLQGALGSSPGLSLRYTNNEYPAEKPLWIDADGGPIKIGNNSAYYLTTGITLGSATTPVNISDAFTLPAVDGAAGEVLTTDGAGNVSWQASSGGSVTSVTLDASTTGLTISGGTSQTITTSGTFTLGGTLGVANGGTGTGTAFTQGSIVFAGPSGVYAQDNANLFWDDSNNRLGIGTASPAYTLQASTSGNTVIDATTTSTANYGQLYASSPSNAGWLRAYGSGVVQTFLNSSDASWVTIQNVGGNGVKIGAQEAGDQLQLGSYEASIDTTDVRVAITDSNIVFNGSQRNYDLRVASQGNANMLFVDASANAVGVNTASPVAGFLDVAAFLRARNVTNDVGAYQFNDSAGTVVMQVDTVNRQVGIRTTATPVAALDIASGQLAIPDGSASAPAVAFRDDLNTGLFSPSGDVVGVAVNGSEVARLLQTGTGLTPALLMGTSSPLGAITVDSNDPSATAGVVMLGHGAAGTVIEESYRGGQFVGVRTRGTKAAPTAVGTGDGLANILGAGYTSASGYNYGALISLKADQAFTSSASGGRIEFHTTANGSDGFTTLGSSTTERMRITNSGNVGIGTATPASLLSVGSSSQFQINSSGDIVAIRGQTTTFPAANAAGALTNDGSGNLSWSTTGAVTGSGVATRVAFWSGTSSLSSDSNLYWDDSNNRLGIGVATPAHVVDVQAGSTASGVYALNVDATLTPGGGTIVSYIEGSVSASVTAPVYGVIGYLSGAGTPSTSYAGYFGTVIAGSGQDPVSALQANFALLGSAAGSTATGHNVGVWGGANSSSARNYGIFGNTTGDTSGVNVAVTGMAKNNSGIRIGGLFALQTTGASQPTVNASAALIADNMDKGDPIFLARDNGTTTFSVGNDGVVLSKNTSDSTTAFQVQNAAGTTVLDVDTSNARVGVGTNAPTALIDVVGSSGIRFRTNSSSAGFDIFDRPSVPGDQLVFQGNTGNYTLFNVATKNATSASEKLSAFSLWSVDIANTGNATQLQVQNNPTYGGVFFTQKFGTGTERKISLQSEWQQSSTPTQLVLDTNGNVGIGTATPTSTFSVGSTSQFQVSSTGDIVAIRGQTTTFPAANAAGVLTNNGSGTLSWVSASSQNGTMPISTKTANYTLTSSDGTILADATSGAITITLPSAASSTERIFTIKKKDVTANIVTVDADASELIDGATTYALSTQYEAIKIQSDGSAWWII